MKFQFSILKFLKNRKVLLTTIFIFLLTAAYILRNPEVVPFSKESRIFFPDFDKAQISRIEIGEKEDVLRVESGEWRVENENDFPADEEAIESALDTAEKLERQELVSKNKANHGNFGVGGDGIKVRFIGDEQSYELIVGSRGPGFGNSYARRADEDMVYLVGESLDFMFSQDDWRDFKLSIKNEKLKIKNIEVKNSNGEFEFKKEEEKWKLVKPNAQDNIVQTRVEDLINRLAALEAVDATVSAELYITGFDNPLITISIKGESGKDKLLIGNIDNFEQRWAQVSGNPYFYLLAPSDYGVFEEIDAEYFTSENLSE